jgi:hypothetical protein
VSRKGPATRLSTDIPEAFKTPPVNVGPKSFSQRMDAMDEAGEALVFHVHLSYKALGLVVAVVIQLVYVYTNVILEACHVSNLPG